MSEIDNKYMNEFRGWTRLSLTKNYYDKDLSFPFKHSNYKFHLAKDLDTFLKKYKRAIDASLFDELYELVPFEPPQGLPMYFDIEWESYSKTDTEPLDFFAMSLSEYCKDRYPNQIDDSLPGIFTTATRTKVVNNKKCYKHSYHWIIRNGIHFKNQFTLGEFVKDYRNWCHNSTRPEIRDKLYNLSISQITGNGVDQIPDLSVYNKNPDTFRAMRMPYAHKGKTDSILYPPDTEHFNTKPKDYFIAYVSSKSKLFEPDISTIPKEIVVKKNIQSKLYLPLGDIEIPSYVIQYAKTIFRNYHPNAEYLSSEVINDGVDYRMLFTDSTSKCLCCRRTHTKRKNGYHSHAIHYRTLSNDYLYRCRNAEGYAIKLTRTVGAISNWDYDYNDYTGVNFKPLELDFIGEGGTFLGQSAKGTGKSESIVNFVSRLPKETSIMYPSFRINLCAKNHQELKDFGFSYYKDKDFNPHRAIVCLNSINKCVPQKKYDIIIIDEIYSVLESFSSPLMKDRKNEVMLIFEKFIKDAKRVYCMDAHLDNPLVIRPLHALRNPDKFVYHKNPNAHNYSDYTIYYDEYSNRNKEPFENLEKKMICDIENGKKIAIMCSSKNQSDTFGDLFKSLFPNVKVNLYNSDTDGKQKRDDFKDTMKSWGNGEVKVIIYSPTVSAGISYNDVSVNGVNKLYCFIAGGRNLPSFNTTRQMFFRVRQLIDKEIYVMMSQNFIEESVEEKDLENQLRRNLIDLNKSVLDPFLKLIGIDDDFKPIFDTDSWGYKLWLETKREVYNYGSVSKIKEGIHKEFSNPPDDPNYPGRGMNWVDLTTGEIPRPKSKLDLDVVNKKSDLEKLKKNNLVENYCDITIIDEDRFIELSDRLKKGENPLDEIENFQYKRFIRCSQFDVDLELVHNNRLTGTPPQFIRDREIYDAVEYTIELEPPDISSYRNYKTWVNSYDKESFKFSQERNLLKYLGVCSYEELGKIKGGVRTLKKIDKPQLIDEITKLNYHKLNSVNTLLEFCDLPLFETLEGITITVDKLQEILLRDDFVKVVQPISDTIQGLFKNLSKYNRANSILKDWYSKNDELFWKQNRKELRDHYKFYDKFIEFNEKNWAKNYEKYKSNPDKFKQEVLEGWCPTPWKKYRVDKYNVSMLVKLINLSVGYIGFKLEKGEEEKRLHRVATKYIFKFKYENLRPIQIDRTVKDSIVKDSLDKMDMRDNGYRHWKPVKEQGILDDIIIVDGKPVRRKSVDSEKI
jgi:hypothetical protein